MARGFKYLLLLALLTGCTTIPGLVADDDEKAACKRDGCTVWTVDELSNLARRFFNEGYVAGKKSI